MSSCVSCDLENFLDVWCTGALARTVSGCGEAVYCTQMYNENIVSGVLCSAPGDSCQLKSFARYTSDPRKRDGKLAAQENVRSSSSFMNKIEVCKS